MITFHIAGIDIIVSPDATDEELRLILRFAYLSTEEGLLEEEDRPNSVSSPWITPHVVQHKKKSQ